jgi:hypothetical protein
MQEKVRKLGFVSHPREGGTKIFAELERGFGEAMALSPTEKVFMHKIIS